MSHLNDLHEKFSGRGLSILAVTDEPEKPTEEFVEKTGMKYAYAYDPGGKFQRQLGVSGIPHAFLVDPGGRIVWEGHPASLQESAIEEHLDGALTKPVWELVAEPETKKVGEALRKCDFKKALEEARKLGGQSGIADAIARVLERRLKVLEESYEDGDYLSAVSLAEGLAKEAKGLPEGDRAAKILKEIKRDAKAQKVLKAQQKILSLLEEPPRRRKDAEEVIAKLSKIEKRMEGTFAARQAASAREELEALLDRLP